MPPKFKRHLDEEQRVHLLGDHDSGDEDFAQSERRAAGPSKPSVRFAPGSDKLSRVQGQIGEVMGVMQANIGRVLERGERLEDLQDKTDDLAAGALTFHKSSSQLRKKMWWKQCKMRIFLVVVILIIIGIIVIPIIIKSRPGSDKPLDSDPLSQP